MLKALYLGGCRSGKSRLALKKANGMGEGSKFFLATCSPEDPEMQERVIRHQEDRGPDWITLEEPLQVRERIEDCNQKGGVVLLDCLTLWVSNLMAQGHTDKEMFALFQKLGETVNRVGVGLVLVSNEVGSGLVPENALARRYRDLVGRLNQDLAQAVDEVYFTVAGQAIRVK